MGIKEIDTSEPLEPLKWVRIDKKSFLVQGNRLYGWITHCDEGEECYEEHVVCLLELGTTTIPCT